MELAITLLVLAGAVLLFVTEKFPVDVVAILVLCSLLVLGVVTPREALSGFSSQATLTVAAMFVLSAGLQRSGLIAALGEAMARIRRGWLFALTMMLLAALLSAFVNNTAIVAIFIPMVIAAVAGNRQSPSRFLIPLSFAAQFGGVCTLVGTSTNLLVDSLARQAGLPGFGLFEFTSLGLWFVGAGVAYLMLARRFLLPDLGVPDSATDQHHGRYLTELHVPPGSPAIGKRGAEVLPLDTGDAYLLEIRRDGALLAQPRASEVQAGDALLLRGAWGELRKARKALRLRFDPVAADLAGNPQEDRLHAEVMVAPGSHLAGKSLAQLRFGHTYRVLVHGLQRPGATLRLPPQQVPLQVGDVLLLDAPASALDALRDERGLVVMGQRPQVRLDARRAAIALLALAGAIGAAALGLAPIVAAALLGCVLLVVGGVLKAEEAYAAVDWRVIVLLAGVLPLGIALQKSGGADWMAQYALGWAGAHGPLLVLAVVYLMTAVMTEVMSNNAAAVLVVPIAIAAAEAMGIDARPLLVAVAFAASTSFATPVGYQTNTMVYAAGGYRFADFPRIGIPLNLVFWAMAVLLIPRYFPFHPA
jgi:di/tricarboxylate transporter